jgi:hypothetical protein
MESREEGPIGTSGKVGNIFLDLKLALKYLLNNFELSF